MSTRTTHTFTGMHGNTLVADSWGTPSAPPVIFLHGGGQTRHAWGGAALRMAEAGWFALSLDLRGHGDSGWTETYDRDHFGGDIVEVVRALSTTTGAAGQPVLVGASLGGISSVFAEDIAEGPLARALVLVDIAPHVEQAGITRIMEFMATGRDGFATIEDAADTVAAYLRERARPKDVSGLRKNLRLKDDGRWYWHWDPAFLSNVQADRERDFTRMADAARRLTAPVLLVRGAKSDVLADAGVAAFKDLVPHAKFADIAGAGHMVAGDKNDAFTGAILSFAAELEGTTR